MSSLAEFFFYYFSKYAVIKNSAKEVNFLRDKKVVRLNEIFSKMLLGSTRNIEISSVFIYIEFF